MQRSHGTAQHSTAQHSTAQHSTAQHSTAQHQGGGSQVLGGARGEVQLSGVAQEVDGAMVEGVPRGRPGGALVINIRHAGVVGLVEALIEGHAALSTCHTHMPLMRKTSIIVLRKFDAFEVIVKLHTACWWLLIHFAAGEWIGQLTRVAGSVVAVSRAREITLVVACHQHDWSLCGQHLKLVHEHIPHCLLTSALPEHCITTGTHP